MRGRKPQPKGGSDEALSVVPSPPMWLGEAARSEWRRVTPLLVERRVLTESDLATLANFCSAVGDARMAAEAIEKDGMTVNGKQHPLLNYKLKCIATAARLATDLGLTPASRQKYAGAKEDEQTDFWAELGLV